MHLNLAQIGDTAIAMIERQRALDGLADRIQSMVRRAFRAAGPAEAGLKNALHGTWLGHPLHAVLSDVPVGAWTAAIVMDILEGRAPRRDARGYAAGADTAIAIGIAGAVAAAVPGLADWHHTRGGTRRSGLAHALLNTAALALYTGSFALRRAARRRDARVLARLGFGVLLASAYIGGHLVYRLRVGIDQSQPTLEAADFIPVLPLAELRDGALRGVEVQGHSVLLVRQGDHVAALAARCSHLGGPLPEGRLEDGTVRCPWHGSRFALNDGRVVEGPATAAQPCFETRIRQGQIEIRRSTPDAPAPARDAGAAAG